MAYDDVTMVGMSTTGEATHKSHQTGRILQSRRTIRTGIDVETVCSSEWEEQTVHSDDEYSTPKSTGNATANVFCQYDEVEKEFKAQYEGAPFSAPKKA
jgi:hypothetical protein